MPGLGLLAQKRMYESHPRDNVILSPSACSKDVYGFMFVSLQINTTATRIKSEQRASATLGDSAYPRVV